MTPAAPPRIRRWRQATNPLPGKTDPRRKGAYFPFEPPNRLEARRAGQVQPAIKAALDIVIQFKPYQIGNDNLWLLNEASITDKHEVPIIVICALQGGIMNFPATPSTGFGLQLTLKATQPILVEDGKVFARDDRRRAHAHEDDQFTFDIAFGECGALQGKPVLPTLREFAGITNAIAEAFLRAGLMK